MPKKSLRDRLMDIKYFYTYGLFDIFRHGEKHLLQRYTPNSLRAVDIKELSKCDSLIVISAKYPIEKDDVENLTALDDQNGICDIAAAPLVRLFEASEKACGEKILFTSTYRTLAFQDSLYGVNPFAVKAGESEHHSGLVADIKVDGYAQRRFIMSKTGKWMAKNAHRFGFIIRYPLWGERKTGVNYEPWHLRYVGEPHAQIIYRSKIVLEEYLDMLSEGEFFRFGDYVISKQSGEHAAFPAEAQEIFCSKDTRGGLILWGKVLN